ncbi:MAG TPA: protein kinase, partial [Polyangiaceae bacterium]|nr:protein kinase [Polyangiaceae bacterium]
MSHELQTLRAPPLDVLIADKYRLVRFLGAGGVGAVYEAEAPDGTHVALKIMLADVVDRELVERFRREAFTSSLDSTHIVKTIHAGVDETLRAPFLIMPLMVGFDLGNLLDRIGPIHPTVAVRIVRQVCAALSVAHQQGIVHRDVKPANVFLDHDSHGKVTVRVLDFGVAKWRSTDAAQLTRTNSLVGTPLYMAPEQFEDGKDVDTRSDLWALGCTLFETLSGTVPFGADAKNVAELVLALAQTDARPLQELAPWVDPALACIVHGALIRNRDARCPNSDALAEALLPFAADSDELLATMFEPLPDEARCYRAPLLSSTPASWQVEAPSTVAPTMALGDADPLLGKVLAGRYTLLQCLGRGGMGAVYEASTLEGSRIAVKVIRPEIAGTSASARRRFVREAKVVQSLDNRYIVRVLDVDTDPEQELPFMAMELLHGHDLGMLIQQRGALSPATVARLFV